MAPKTNYILPLLDPHRSADQEILRLPTIHETKKWRKTQKRNGEYEILWAAKQSDI